MKNNFSKLTLVIIMIILGLTLYMISCTESTSLEPYEAGQINAAEGYNFNNNPSILSKPRPDNTYTYPIWGKQNFYNKKGVWQGGTILLSNGSKFTIQTGAMIPPFPDASSYYITVRADLDSLNNQIIVSFTPAGILFDPPAELILDWNDLGIEVATLFYIDENGEYLLQTPNHIDYNRRQLTIYIDHFSRYAIGME